MQLAKIGDFYLEINDVQKAILYYQKAKKTYEGLKRIQNY